MSFVEGKPNGHQPFVYMLILGTTWQPILTPQAVKEEGGTVTASCQAFSEGGGGVLAQMRLNPHADTAP